MTAYTAISGRKRLELIHGFKYRIFYHDEENRFTCFYCGRTWGIVLDHQPPLTRISDYEALNLKYPCYIKVPSCRECNRLLGAELTETLFERKALCNEKLRKKYRRAEASPIWEPDELEELGGSLRAYVEESSDAAEYLEARVGYSKGIQAYADAGIEND